MTDDIDSGRIEWERQQGQLSAGSLEWYRNRLNDEAFARDFPQAHKALRESVDRALAASQQTLDRPVDGRTEAQASFDRRMGVTYEDGKPQLPGDLHNTVARETDGEAHDPHDVAFQLSNIGRSYKADFEAATRLLSQVGLQVEASKLSASTIANLAIFSDHLARHQSQRPK